jgi:hypothetical protein
VKVLGHLTATASVWMICGGLGTPAAAAARTPCLSPSVHAAIPAGATTIGFQGTTPPWVATPDRHVVAFLFYYGGRPFRDGRQVPAYMAHATIATHGRVPQGSTKILWWVRGKGAGPTLTVTGTRLDAAGAFRQVVSGNGRTFPSIVDVPTAGCWRLSLRSGKVTGGLIVRAIDA